VISRIALDAERFDADALRALEEFSHIEVVYLFDRVEKASIERRARRPRNNPDWPEVGVFAQRNKRRPNRTAIGGCELLEVAGTVLEVRGLDAIDHTQVLDLKSYMTEFAPRSPVRQPRWSRELMATGTSHQHRQRRERSSRALTLRPVGGSRANEAQTM
jgi:tRNA (Thr-GGU) A37 N-methylase